MSAGSSTRNYPPAQKRSRTRSSVWRKRERRSGGTRRCPALRADLVSRGEKGGSETPTQNHQKRQGYPLGKKAKMAKNVKNESPPRAPETFNNTSSKLLGHLSFLYLVTTCSSPNREWRTSAPHQSIFTQNLFSSTQIFFLQRKYCSHHQQQLYSRTRWRTSAPPPPPASVAAAAAAATAPGL
eukprot:SAG22_NODE_2704_length_2297_cov_4.788444_2_plen_183_part_00